MEGGGTVVVLKIYIGAGVDEGFGHFCPAEEAGADEGAGAAHGLFFVEAGATGHALFESIGIARHNRGVDIDL